MINNRANAAQPTLYEAHSVTPYHAAEMPLPAYNKQYLGLAGLFGSTLGYPNQAIHYISLVNQSGQTLEFEVDYETHARIKAHADMLNLTTNENLWLWISVDNTQGLERWRLFKSHLPSERIQSLYQYAYHVDSLLNLLELIQGIKTWVLRDFAESLLYNDSLMKAWLTIPASKRHHHSFPGGLMAHSLEVAKMVKDDMRYLDGEVKVSEQDVTVLAALLHDIGKTQTLGQANHTDLGRLVDHEKLTLMILAEPISQLKQKWPQGASALQYLLVWKTTDGFSRFIGGEIIKNADQISTKLSLRRMAFEGKPEYFNYAVLKLGYKEQYLNRLPAVGY